MQTLVVSDDRLEWLDWTEDTDIMILGRDLWAAFNCIDEPPLFNMIINFIWTSSETSSYHSETSRRYLSLGTKNYSMITVLMRVISVNHHELSLQTGGCLALWWTSFPLRRLQTWRRWSTSGTPAINSLLAPLEFSQLHLQLQCHRRSRSEPFADPLLMKNSVQRISRVFGNQTKFPLRPLKQMLCQLPTVRQTAAVSHYTPDVN